jgi:hypothetical protein
MRSILGALQIQAVKVYQLNTQKWMEASLVEEKNINVIL